MLIVTMAEDMGSYIHKGLSEWWSEESEYLYQRIERWAALSRGYNRLKSVRISRARMTMKEKPNEDLYWCGSSSSNYSIKRSRTTDETRRINCCGTFNYESNNNFNSTCLDAYRYDHSIYFKTIGDIKNSKRNLYSEFNDNNKCLHERDVDDDDHCQYYSCCKNNHRDELDLRVHNNDSASSIEIEANVVRPSGDVYWDYLYRKNLDDSNIETMFNNVWPIVDLSMINENVSDHQKEQQHVRQSNDDADADDDDDDDDDSNNNSNLQCENQIFLSSNIHEETSNTTDHSDIARVINFHKPMASSNIVSQPVFVLENNNITWPGVILNYTSNNTDSSELSVSYQQNFHDPK